MEHLGNLNQPWECCPFRCPNSAVGFSISAFHLAPSVHPRWRKPQPAALIGIKQKQSRCRVTLFCPEPEPTPVIPSAISCAESAIVSPEIFPLGLFLPLANLRHPLFGILHALIAISKQLDKLAASEVWQASSIALGYTVKNGWHGIWIWHVKKIQGCWRFTSTIHALPS